MHLRSLAKMAPLVTLLLVMVFSVSSSLFAQGLPKDDPRVIKLQNEKYNTIVAEITAPADAIDYYVLGRAHLALKNTAKASEVINAGIAAFATFEMLNYLKMEYLLVTGDTTKVRADILYLMDEYSKEKVKIATLAGEAFVNAGFAKWDFMKEMIDEALKAKNADKSDELKALLGDYYLANNKGSDATRMYNDAKALNEKNMRALLGYADIYTKVKNEVAIEAYEAAIATDTMYAPAYRIFSEFLRREQIIGMALLQYEKYLALSEKTQEKLRNYTSMLFLAKRYEDCIAASREGLVFDAKNSEFVQRIAYSYYSLNKFEEADKYFTEYFALTSPELYLTIDHEYYGKALVKQKKDADASVQFIKAMEKDTSRADLLTDLAGTYYRQKSYKLAHQTFNQKISRGVTMSVNEYYFLGMAYFFDSLYTDAIGAYGKVIEGNPTFIPAYLFSARAEANMDPESALGKARPFYEKVIELALTDAEKNKGALIESYNYLGYFYYLQFEADNKNVDAQAKAKNYYNELLKLDPNYENAKIALKALN